MTVRTDPCPWCGGDGLNPLFADSRERGDPCTVCRGAGEVTSELRRTGPYTFEYREREAQEEMLFGGEG